MHRYLILLGVLMISMPSFGQGYNTAIGLRLGKDLGFTLQQRIANRTTVEAIFYGGNSDPDTYANLLLRQHLPLFSKKINAYVGVGFGSYWRFVNDEFTQQKYTIPGVIGLEMSFGRINISGDVMPHFVFNEGTKNSYQSIANVSLRLILFKRKVEAKKSIKDKFGDMFPKDSKKKKKKKQK